MTTLTWTPVETTQPGWSLEIGLLSQPVDSISVTQGVENWQYPEVLLAYGQGGKQFLGYCEVFIGNPSGDCLVTSIPNGTGTDYTFTFGASGIDRVSLGAYGATGFPSATFAADQLGPASQIFEPPTLVLLTIALVIAAALAVVKKYSKA